MLSLGSPVSQGWLLIHTIRSCWGHYVAGVLCQKQERFIRRACYLSQCFIDPLYPDWFNNFITDTGYGIPPAPPSLFVEPVDAASPPLSRPANLPLVQSFVGFQAIPYEHEVQDNTHSLSDEYPPAEHVQVSRPFGFSAFLELFTPNGAHDPATAPPTIISNPLTYD